MRSITMLILLLIILLLEWDLFSLQYLLSFLLVMQQHDLLAMRKWILYARIKMHFLHLKLLTMRFSFLLYLQSSIHFTKQYLQLLPNCIPLMPNLRFDKMYHMQPRIQPLKWVVRFLQYK